MKPPFSRILSMMLAASAALAPTQAAAPAPAEMQTIILQAKKDKEIVRDPRKAEREKKKALREGGVKMVRVSSPSDWPKKVPVPEDTELRALEKQQGEDFFRYESNHYIFYSQAELSEAGQKMIGRLFECTYAADKAVAAIMPVPRADLPRTERKYKAVLVRNMNEYYRMGGAKGSSGVYIHSRRMGDGKIKEEDIVREMVLVPFCSLGLDENGKMVAPDIDTHTLVHEITHQNFVLNNLPIWANEGWAEYVGYVPYMGEALDFDKGFSLILHKAKKSSSGGVLKFDFTLEDFFVMPQEEMYGYMSKGEADTYTLGAMLIAFFVHLDGKRGIEAMKDYMQALVDGESQEDAAKKLIAPYKNLKNLQKAFTKAWKRKKVELELPEAK